MSEEPQQKAQKVFRSSDLVEVHSEKAITAGIGSLFAFAISAVLLYYRGSTGMFVPLAVLILVGGVGALGYALYWASRIRRVTYVFASCPFCSENNALTETPTDDFLCAGCNRLIPVLMGKVLTVQQVRCGYCTELNYFSEKTDVLLCESCNHEIPIAHEEGHVSKKTLASGYAVEDDLRPYELVLVDSGHHTEDLIRTLQQMLALNRNQVKQMLDELPVTLLTGVPKKKAEMLRAQLSVHDALADCRPMTESVL